MKNYVSHPLYVQFMVESGRSQSQRLRAARARRKPRPIHVVGYDKK